MCEDHSKELESGDMELSDEQEIKMIQFTIDINMRTRQYLLHYGRQHIVNDEDAIINYAVNKLMREMIDREQIIEDAGL